MLQRDSMKLENTVWWRMQYVADKPQINLPWESGLSTLPSACELEKLESCSKLILKPVLSCLLCNFPGPSFDWWAGCLWTSRVISWCLNEVETNDAVWLTTPHYPVVFSRFRGLSFFCWVETFWSPCSREGPQEQGCWRHWLSVVINILTPARCLLWLFYLWGIQLSKIPSTRQNVCSLFCMPCMLLINPSEIVNLCLFSE